MKNRIMKTVGIIFAMTLLVAGCATEQEEQVSESDVVQEEAQEESVYETATLEEVKAALEDDSVVVLDAREADVYSGWSVGDNVLGGHIAGSSNFAADWLTCTYDDDQNLDNMTLEEQLENKMSDKNISEDSTVIIYDEAGGEAVLVADYLSSKGVTDIKTFDLADWDEERETYENYTLWLPASVVKDVIDGEEVEEVTFSSDPIILEVSWGDSSQSGYLDGHVPTAIHVNSDDFDDADNSYMLKDDEWQLELAASFGITTDSTVILVGDGIYSCRYGVILKYLGVEEVYVMSGGVNAWTEAGYEYETEETFPVAVDSFGADEPLNPDIIDTVSEVKELLAEDDFILVDNRTWEEYIGEDTGYSYCPTAGRIEGAVYGYAGVDNSSSMLYYRNPDSTMRQASEIEEMWAEAGVDVTQHLSFMCGGGYRAAEIIWDAWVMGYENTSLYSDGWIGWQLTDEPYVVGE